MSARHSAAPRGNSTARRVVLVGALLVAVALVVVGVLALLTRLGVGGLCSGGETVTVAAEPGIAPHVETLVGQADGCHEYSVEAVSSADISSRVSDREEMPDLWVPDSAVRLAQISAELQLPFDTVLNSLASTPVVIATHERDVDMSTWTAALSTPGLAMGDPVRSGTADAPILAATSEVENMRSDPDALGAAMAALAQGQDARMETPPGERELLDGVAAEGGAAIVSEQQAVRAQDDGAAFGLTAPATGAVFLTYPLAVTTQDPERRDEVTEAAEELRDEALAPAFVDGLADDDFRGADRAPLADEQGVGEVRALVVRDPNRVHTTLQRWRLLSMPTRSLVLMDTSGSMGFDLPGTGTTRIQALVETATAGLGSFPDDAELGLWAFGGDAGRDGLPYGQVAPIQRLDEQAPEGTVRESLAGALGELPGMVGGGTDLYQTVLDAYGMVRGTYDPNMINALVVISDGANDNDSPLTRDDFLERLRGLVDPSRPVVVVTVGLLEDADPAMLAEISELTGGSSHFAQTPDEIVRVFAEAIGQRGRG